MKQLRLGHKIVWEGMQAVGSDGQGYRGVTDSGMFWKTGPAETAGK